MEAKTQAPNVWTQPVSTVYEGSRWRVGTYQVVVSVIEGSADAQHAAEKVGIASSECRALAVVETEEFNRQP